MRGLPLSKHKVLFNPSSSFPLYLLLLKSSHPICLIILGCGSIFSQSFLVLSLIPFCSVSIALGFIRVLLQDLIFPLCCGRPDVKPLSLRAQDVPGLTLFTLGCISIKLALSPLMPSITNSVCLSRVHFPLRLHLFVTVNK